MSDSYVGQSIGNIALIGIRYNDGACECWATLRYTTSFHRCVAQFLVSGPIVSLSRGRYKRDCGYTTNETAKSKDNNILELNYYFCL